MNDQALRDVMFTTQTAEKLRIGVQQYLSREHLHCLAGGLDAHIYEIADGLAIQISSFVLATGGETISIHRRWPRDWWQAFKLRWFPKWALSRWPATYDEIDIERRVYEKICPHVAVPEGGRHYEFLAHGRDMHILRQPT